MAEPSRSRSPWRANRLLVGFAALLFLAIRRVVMPRSREHATTPAAASPNNVQHENPDTAFEPSDWALRPVALVYVGTLVLLVVSSLVLIAAYPNALPDVARTVRIAPPGPRLQTDPRGDLRRFRAEEDKRLNSYYWTDKSKGIVHIPIEQAMQKLAKTGIPDFAKAPQ